MILVVNTGSSSLKAKLFDAVSFEVVEQYSFSNIRDIPAFRKSTLELLGKIDKYYFSIDIIAHRIVMGGKGSIDGEEASKTVLARLRRNSHLAPLHTPASMAVIETMIKKFPKIKNVLAHDIAYYSGLPETEYTYPIDQKICRKLGIRRYGFHGISHRYAYEQAGINYDKVVSLHLGAGCSATAIYRGQAIATSMGLTPQGGLVMQTRCGDIDPGVIFAIASKYGLRTTKLLFENGSGLKGLTATDGDMLRLLEISGNPIEDNVYVSQKKHSSEDKIQAQLAIDIYCQRAKDYIGTYSARMSGLDAIIFTGKIGYGSGYIRDRITYGLDYLNLKEVIKVDPNEELAIAKNILK